MCLRKLLRISLTFFAVGNISAAFAFYIETSRNIQENKLYYFSNVVFDQHII